MKEGHPASIRVSPDSAHPHNLSYPVSLSFPEADLRRNMPWFGMPEMRISGPLRETIALPPVEMSPQRSRMPVQDSIVITQNGKIKEVSLHMRPRLFVHPDIVPLIEEDDFLHILQTASSLDLSLTTDGLLLEKKLFREKKRQFEIDHTSGQGITWPTLGSETLQVSQTDPEMFSTAWVHEATKTAARNVFKLCLWEGVQYDKYASAQNVAAYYVVNYPVKMTHTIPYFNLVQEMTSPKTYDGRRLHTIIDPAIIVNYV